RQHHSRRHRRAHRHRQPLGAAAQRAEGRVRAVSALISRTVSTCSVIPGTVSQTKTPPRKRRGVVGLRRSRRLKGDQSFLRKPENFFWNRETRPPRSRICCAPPTQAGCDLGSMSRCSLSPSLPQVERVWYSVPSVITTVMV